MRFYATLTEFIASGKAYASTLGRSRGEAVKAVLVAMQKLASSSVAAVAAALSGRLSRIEAARTIPRVSIALREQPQPGSFDDDDDESMPSTSELSRPILSSA